MPRSFDGVVEEPGTPRLFRREAPAFHDDPDNARLFPPFHDITVTTPPVFTVSLRNATLVGFRSIVSSEGYFVHDLGHLTPDDTRSFVEGLPQSIELGPLTPIPRDEAFACRVEECPQAYLEGPVVVLTSAEPGNFSCLIYREIVKLVNLKEIPSNWRFLIHASLASWAEFLGLAGVSADRILHHDLRTVYRLDQAIIPGLRAPYALADSQAHAFYGWLRAKCETGARGRRIYVSRLAVSAARPNGGVMLNEEELVGRLQDLGFDVVEPERLSAAEQISQFAGADLVVGPSGSGMFNSVLCREGTKLIDIESEPHWIYPHTCLFASAGLRYGIFEGLAANRDWSVHHRPFTVNIEALLRRIEAFDPREAASQDQRRRRGRRLVLDDPRPFRRRPSYGARARPSDVSASDLPRNRGRRGTLACAREMRLHRRRPELQYRRARPGRKTRLPALSDDQRPVLPRP